ncbi:RNA-binding protein [Sporothrix brasiliensis 5110]|uniref:RNA-binding protein n=1 Tax=Sporothrix brasiliensis 5110 TaxID=1398154 RepID=A0A0C2IIF3_9PEZI|nr:RNA-binding protein [Sporothrix brasiliensis 5110]KIH86765.1 RNA-binding protein [Sporothrix brasiliensis 5110]
MATDIETKAAAAAPTEGPSSPFLPSAQKKRKAANDDVPEIEVDLSLPEPPSKRAKRALKKGKVLPAKPRSDDEGDDDIPAKGGKSGDKDDNKKAERSQFGIWIGNLPFTVTRPQLFQWFIDCSGGAISEADITRVNLPLGKRQPHQQRPHNVNADSNGNVAPPNKGFAYVDFLTYEAQVAATALSETELDGRRVLIKDSKSFEGRPAKEREGAGAGATTGAAGDDDGKNGADASAAPAAGMTSSKIFVGNLGFDTTEEDLRRHFTPCGPVAWAKVATFPDNTEKCRGYGWVQFGGKTDDGQNITPEAASKAAAAAVTGFARITETVDTEEDFAAEAAVAAGDMEDEDDVADTKEATKPAPRTRQRKWWVNQLKGRPLKIQFAEDDAMRYKKRFRKGGRPQGDDGEGRGGNKAREPRERRPRPDNQQYKHQDATVAYRTGAITASLGKKTMLE